MNIVVNVYYTLITICISGADLDVDEHRHILAQFPSSLYHIGDSIEGKKLITDETNNMIHYRTPENSAMPDAHAMTP